MGGKTNARLCMNNPHMAHVKIIGGRVLYDRCEKANGLSGVSGVWDKKTSLSMCDQVRDLMPWFEDLWNNLNEGNQSIDEWLRQRARKCMPWTCNELDVFKTPAWESSWDLVSDALNRNQVIHFDDVFLAQERQLIMTFKDYPGVYIGELANGNERRIRIGMSATGVGTRYETHWDYGLKPIRFFSSLKTNARNLESSIQQYIQLEGGVKDTRYKGKQNSWYIVPDNFDVEDWTKKITKILRPYFFNTRIPGDNRPLKTNPEGQILLPI